MPMYIRSAACVSPFFPLEGKSQDLLAMLKESSDRAADGEGKKSSGQAVDKTQTTSDPEKLTAIEPDYAQYIDPKMIRRMSRIVKMGVATALSCLKPAGNPMPGAIITGTAYGCLEDTGTFLRKMITNQEELLSPTAFIQSTHNTVGAQVALLLKCHSYNNTIVHRAFSFEHSLTEARMLLEENLGPVLVGAIDETTAESFSVLRRFGLFRRASPEGGFKPAGNAAGEGAAFFLLQREASGLDLAYIEQVSTAFDPKGSADDTLAWIGSRLDLLAFDRSRIGTLIDGSGLLQQRPVPGVASSNYIDFKSLCGEFPTATGFAVWLAALCCENLNPTGMRKSVLIVNRSPDGHNILLIVSPC